MRVTSVVAQRGRAAHKNIALLILFSPQRAPDSPRSRSRPRSTNKELLHYHRELEQQIEKVSKMRANGADEFDIKKQVRTTTRTGPSVSPRAHSLTRPLPRHFPIRRSRSRPRRR